MLILFADFLSFYLVIGKFTSLSVRTDTFLKTTSHLFFVLCKRLILISFFWSTCSADTVSVLALFRMMVLVRLFLGILFILTIPTSLTQPPPNCPSFLPFLFKKSPPSPLYHQRKITNRQFYQGLYFGQVLRHSTGYCIWTNVYLLSYP